jgi:uncharacterized protein YndB with AHSA1/START domain/effector-binding domain-containing protein
MSFYPDSFTLTTPSDREIAVTRDFHAPREVVFDAFTKPELVRRWLLGPPGWTMPVCEIDLRVGGRYRYVWHKASTGEEMGMGGEFRHVARPSKLVATEKFDHAWYPGEALDTTTFEERAGITTVRLVVRYETKEARDTATRSGMEKGMAAGYDRLEQIIAAPAGDTAGRSLIDEPSTSEMPAIQAAAIHLTIPRDQIQQVMGPGIGEVMEAVQAQGVGPAGPWFTHHLKMEPGTFDFEICVPVSAPVKPVGRVEPREFPARQIAQTTYRGPYDELGPAWGELDEWMKAQGHSPAPDLFEVYVAGPESGPDSANWRTELRRPLRT